MIIMPRMDFFGTRLLLLSYFPCYNPDLLFRRLFEIPIEILSHLNILTRLFCFLFESVFLSVQVV